VNRLEGMRGQLAADVENMARHLEAERNRLRSSLTEVLKWVDDNIQPANSLMALRPRGDAPRGGDQPRPADTAARPPSAPRPAQGQQPQARASGTVNGVAEGPKASDPVAQALDLRAAAGGVPPIERN
jgi:hypothetical protein